MGWLSESPSTGFHRTGSRVESRRGRSHVWPMTFGLRGPDSFGLRGLDYRVPAEARTPGHVMPAATTPRRENSSAVARAPVRRARPKAGQQRARGRTVLLGSGSSSLPRVPRTPRTAVSRFNCPHVEAMTEAHVARDVRSLGLRAVRDDPPTTARCETHTHGVMTWR